MSEEEGGDTFEETTTESWCDRLGNSFGGLCVGPLLMLISIVLLFWNEGRAVHRQKDLEEVSALVKSLSDITKINPSLDGRLVHISGQTQVNASLYDEDFGVRSDAIKLNRRVETFQWVEDVQTRTKKNTGGSKTTTRSYSYRKEWRRGIVDSSSFKYSSNHVNPKEAQFQEELWTADEVKLGAFVLSDSILDSMNWWAQLTDGLSAENATKVGNGTQGALYHNAIFYGKDPVTPSVGDTRVEFYVVPTAKLTIVAQQSGNTIVPFFTKRGGRVMLLETGLHGAQEMIDDAKSQATLITWLIRLVGFLLSFVGFQMLFEPLTTFADVLPFLGNILEEGVIPCLGFVVSGTISLFIIAIAWLFYRPLLGLCILTVVGGIVYWSTQRARQKQEEQAALLGQTQPSYSSNKDEGDIPTGDFADALGPV